MKHALLVPLLAALAFALPSSAPASADPIDDQEFFTLLEQNGLESVDPATSVGAAHNVCAELWRGVDPEDISEEVRVGTGTLNIEQSRLFVATAIVAYCLPTDTDANGAPIFVA